MARVKKMCTVSLIVLTCNFITNTAVFKVVKDQIILGGHFTDAPFDETWDQNQADPYTSDPDLETAFVDIYGDFESLVELRRDRDLAERYSGRRGFAMAQQEFTKFEDRALTTYKIN